MHSRLIEIRDYLKTLAEFLNTFKRHFGTGFYADAPITKRFVPVLFNTRYKCLCAGMKFGKYDKAGGGSDMTKHVCNLCRTTGHHGAQWIAIVGNDKLHVHKPCGERLAQTAPEGTTVKVVPSPELRQIFQEERRVRETRKFWEQKFAAARQAQR